MVAGERVGRRLRPQVSCEGRTCHFSACCICEGKLAHDRISNKAVTVGGSAAFSAHESCVRQQCIFHQFLPHYGRSLVRDRVSREEPVMMA